MQLQHGETGSVAIQIRGVTEGTLAWKARRAGQIADPASAPGPRQKTETLGNFPNPASIYAAENARIALRFRSMRRWRPPADPVLQAHFQASCADKGGDRASRSQGASLTQPRRGTAARPQVSAPFTDGTHAEDPRESSAGKCTAIRLSTVPK